MFEANPVALAELILEGDRAYAARNIRIALKYFEQAAVLEPADQFVLLRRSVAEADLLNFAVSSACLSRALLVNPQSTDAYFNRAALQLRQRRYDLAQDSSARALVLDPGRCGAYNNRAVADQARALAERALWSYERSLLLRPEGNDRARVNYGQMLLSMARFSDGWVHFSRRFAVDTPHLKTRLPPFSPHALTGRVLLWGDQGVGDQIMFASMLHDWSNLGFAFSVRIDDRLLPLFRRSFSQNEFYGDSTVVDESRFSSQLSLGDLGMYLRSSSAHFEGKGGAFLVADASRTLAIRRLASTRVESADLVIGVSWRSHNLDSGETRSLQLAQLLEYIGLPGVVVINLQYGDTRVDTLAAPQIWDRGGFIDDLGVDNTHDLDGLASVIAACDLVITIANTTAHLSAALGRETWVLIPKAPGWRWMQTGSRTPWYDSAEIFRQTTEADWTGPLESIRRRLEIKASRQDGDIK